jgi:hypothetical protein
VNDNNGCSNVLSCPVGKRVVNIRAACNLESGSVSDSQLAGVPWGNVRVVKDSETNVNNGKCYALSAAISSGTKFLPPQTTWSVLERAWHTNTYPLSQGPPPSPVEVQVILPNAPGVRSVNVGCSEKDSNGGDCHVRAEFTCG